ncbi:hypothetical protein [Sphingomonas panacis]|nr:hypothetical protein [Sphingomonas panacis]
MDGVIESWLSAIDRGDEVVFVRDGEAVAELKAILTDTAGSLER